MIAAIRANQQSFHAIRFKPGLNLILAERTKESDKRDSRNGLGKSTVIDIIHFCLGARPVKGHGIVRDDLADWSFTVDLDLDGQAISLMRKVGDPREIQVSRGDGSGRTTAAVKPEDVNRLLGHLAFGLTDADDAQTYGPSFRSLFSYLVRRGPAAYITFQSHHPKQQEWDKQVNLAYHLDLNWEDAREAQLVKDDAKVVSALKKASKSPTFTQRVGSEGELEVERVRLSTRIEIDRRRLESFKVHEDYRAIELRANELTEQIHGLSNENQQDRRFLLLYQEQFANEQAITATSEQVRRVYAELGLTFPDRVNQRLEQVETFHEAVIENRRTFLSDEIQRLELAIAQREQRIAALDQERASQMIVLRTHGALEEYQALQERLNETIKHLGDIETRIARVRELSDASTQLAIRKRQVEQRARLRFDELTAQRDRAIRLFNSNTEALYQVPGNLIINIGPTGLKFDVEIPRADSEGVGTMKIFCFDLMLSQLWANRAPRLGFLVHDSTLYDPVDERQVASALVLARSEAERLGFQYICALNSDKVPSGELPDDFAIDEHIAVLLTDQTEDGMLLGQRF